MRAVSKFMLAALLIGLVSGCCVKFEDVAPGTQYPVGQTFYTSGTNITVEQFQWANGTWTTNGKARIDATNHAKGTGREINANNVNLRFKFDYPLKKITQKFAELGGNNNMMVNADFLALGPSGYPFEKYFAKIMAYHGYRVETNRVIKGYCVDHEVDVVAVNNNAYSVIECKYHSDAGKPTDVKIALYVHARFQDIKKAADMSPEKDMEFHNG